MAMLLKLMAVSLLLLCCVPRVAAQSDQIYVPPAKMRPGPPPSCGEAPREDADPRLCAPPSGEVQQEAEPEILPPVKMDLKISVETPLRIAIDQRTRISHEGEVVRGRLVETVYAFDQPVIPAGTIATGRVTKIEPVSSTKRTLAYANGNFSPFHGYGVSFETLMLPDGKQLAIKTTVSAGTAEVVHLVSNPEKDKQKGAPGRATDKAKKATESKIQEGKDEARHTWDQLTAPGKMGRLKGFFLSQLPYRRQYLEPGTRFNAVLTEPLDFGEGTRTHEQLAAVGSAPPPDSLLHARLGAEVSSATASRGTPVAAILTEPLYSPDHRLILPVNSRLIGQVLQARPARKLHHNGELRVVFERIETPEGFTQGMQGSLEGVEVDRAAHMKLDEEGGAHATDSKTRYLSTGLTVLLAAAAAHPDAEHGTTDTAGDPGVRTAAGGSGFRLAGALISLAAKSTPVSIAFGAYGASSSIYSNFLSRGRDVVLPKDTSLEIGFGNPHPAGSTTKQK
ncbi:MAG TPA: hypothetical protein VFN26_20895 [Candidatus Acidoferrum sp.]|nr:hypothetical protein [Candidatus Acidoferrum sp.]